MDPSADSPWPEWIRYTLSALAGAFVAVIAVVKAWAKVKVDAETGAALAPRVTSLELSREGMTERLKAMDSKLDRLLDAMERRGK